MTERHDHECCALSSIRPCPATFCCRCWCPAVRSVRPATVWCTMRRSWRDGQQTTPTSTAPVHSVAQPSCLSSTWKSKTWDHRAGTCSSHTICVHDIHTWSTKNTSHTGLCKNTWLMSLISHVSLYFFIASCWVSGTLSTHTVTHAQTKLYPCGLFKQIHSVSPPQVR